MNELSGMHALRWARELSKLPTGSFTIAFYPYSRAKGEASDKLRVIEGCKVRTQLPDDRFSVHADNLFLFTDRDGRNKMCYRILIRYMGFPIDNYQLHKINWL